MRRAQDQATIIEEQREKMKALRQEINEKREYEEKLRVNLNEETERRKRLEEAAASASASANEEDHAMSQRDGSMGDPTMPSTADSRWTGAGAAIVVPGTNGMKLPDFTIRDDAEVWLKRFSVYIA